MSDKDDQKTTTGSPETPKLFLSEYLKRYSKINSKRVQEYLDKANYYSDLPKYMLSDRQRNFLEDYDNSIDNLVEISKDTFVLRGTLSTAEQEAIDKWDKEKASKNKGIFSRVKEIISPKKDAEQATIPKIIHVQQDPIILDDEPAGSSSTINIQSELTAEQIENLRLNREEKETLAQIGQLAQQQLEREQLQGINNEEDDYSDQESSPDPRRRNSEVYQPTSFEQARLIKNQQLSLSQDELNQIRRTKIAEQDFRNRIDAGSTPGRKKIVRIMDNPRPRYTPEEVKQRLAEATIKLNQLVIRPDLFDGTHPRPRRWYEAYEDAIISNDWSEIQSVKYFSTFLVGPAKDWYVTELRPLFARGELYTQKQIKEAFYENYLGTNDMRNLCRYFAQLRQKPGETVSIFIPKARRLCLMMDPNISEREQVRLIGEKLLPEYQMDLARFENNTISALRNICLRVEAGLAATRSIRSSKESSSSGDRFRQGQQRRRFQGRRQGANNFRSYGRNAGNSSAMPPRSYSNKPTPRYTRSRSYPRSDSKSNYQPRSKPPMKITCFRCEREGHYATDCRSVKKMDGTALPDRKAYNTKKVNMVEDNEDTKVLTIKRFEETKPKQVNFIINGKDDLMQQTVSCNGKNIPGTIDTGSQVTVISEKLATLHGWKVTGPIQKLSGASGGVLICPGIAKLDIEMTLGKTTKSKRHSVAVVRDLATDLLIGIDIMTAFSICINIEQRQLSFTKNSRAPGIRTLQALEIPPRTQTSFVMNVNTKGIIMTVPFNTGNDLMIANSISEVVNNKTDVMVCNPTNKTIKIQKNKRVATYEVIDNEDKNTIINLVEKRASKRLDVEISKDLTPKQQESLMALIDENEQAFSHGGEIGKTEFAEHKIELLPDARPHAEPLRRRPYADILEIERQVKDLKAKGYIEDAESPWASACVLAKKKNGEKRLCIDFRKLNEYTKKVVYPLPNIDDCLDTLAGKQYFSQLDMASGFWQIPMEEHSKELTAFRTETGLYQFKRMPFGLTNAPASFQKMINAVFAGLKGLNLQVFIDDICVATETWEEHLMILKQVFQAVIRANLTLKGEKCLFGARRIIFLGHEISAEGIKQDPAKLRALTKLEPPKDREGVRRFLGMSGYYRKFVHNFATLATPLTQLTRKSISFKWGDEEERSFRALIAELEKNATLAHFNHHDLIMLKTDASRSGIAGLLLQQQKGDWKIITCCSRRLTESELNYGITDLEGLALIYSVQKLRNYLLGKPFDIIVDHCALCVLNKRMPNSARLRRWAIILSEFDMNIKYTKGDLHKDIDCLSRAPVNDECDNYLDNKVYVISVPINTMEWTDYYGDDDETEEIHIDAENETNGYKLIDGVIYYGEKLFVPPAKRKEMLRRAHGSATGAHGGVRVTLAKLKHFHWPSISNDTKEYVNSCHCQLRKIDRTGRTGTMYHHEAFEPFEIVGIDAWNTTKASRRNNKVVLVAIDHFTKYLVTKALPSLDAPQCARFISELVGHFGIPKTILTDRANDLTGVIVKETLSSFGIQQKLSTPGHSEGNSIVERAIQTLQDRLASTLNDPNNSLDWDDILPAVTFGVNTSFHSTTKYTPYELLFGREAPLRSESVTTTEDPRDLYAQMLKKQMEYIRAFANMNIASAQDASEDRQELIQHIREFNVGDHVISRNAGKRDDTKTGPKFIGPFEVVSRNRDIYELRHLRTNKSYQRHVSSLKPYRARSATPPPTPARVNLIRFSLAVSLALAVNIGYTEAQLDEVGTLVYMPTEFKIEDSRTHIDLAIALKNPCEKISVQAFGPARAMPDVKTRSCDEYGCFDRVVIPTQNNDTTQNVLIQWKYRDVTNLGSALGIKRNDLRYDDNLLGNLVSLNTTCESKWKEFMDLVETYNISPEQPGRIFQSHNKGRISKRILNNQGNSGHHRAKRDGIASTIAKMTIDTALEIGTAAGINLVTDLVKAVYESYSPNSNTNRIRALEEMTRRHIEKTRVYLDTATPPDCHQNCSMGLFLSFIDQVFWLFLRK